MKILIVIDSLGSGGAERSTEVLADHLESQSIPFCILCLDKKDVGVQQRMQTKNYDIQFLKKANFITEVHQIAKFIKSGKFDLVHSILFRSNLRTRFAKLFVKFIHLESLVNTTYSAERFADEKVNQTLLRFYKKLDSNSASWGVDHFHSITESVKQHYIEKVGFKKEKISVIPRGRKPILASYQEKSINKGTDVVQLINVGRHEFQKGQIFLLQAVKLLKEQGANFNLKIYGRAGTTTPQLKGYIEKYNLQDVASLEGYQSNIPELLLKSDIFVFPSLYEGLGGALIEAQAAGLPIACNNIPVFHEVVNKDQNAVFFDSHDTQNVAEAISELLENRGKRKEFGAKSLKNYQQNFQESVNNKKLLQLYQSLVVNE